MSKEMIVFPALKSNQYAYEFYRSSSNDLWSHQSRTSCLLSNHAGMFDVLGDGMCKHSPSRSVTDTHFADYLSSLAVWLFDHPEDREIMHYAYFTTECRPVRKEVLEFLRDLDGTKKEGDKRFYDPVYYSVELLKVSQSPKMAHDKRWFEWPRFAPKIGQGPGTPEMMAQLWCRDGTHRFSTRLEWYAFQFDAHKVCDRSAYGHEDPLLGDKGEDRGENRRAFELIRVVLALIEAESQAASYVSNVRPAIAKDAVAA